MTLTQIFALVVLSFAADALKWENCGKSFMRFLTFSKSFIVVLYSPRDDHVFTCPNY